MYVNDEDANEIEENEARCQEFACQDYADQPLGCAGCLLFEVEEHFKEARPR